MKKRTFALMALVALLLCSMVLTGCDLLDGLLKKEKDDSEIIQIKNMTFVGDNVTITYEDGFVMELHDVSKNPLLYYREERVSIGFNGGGVTNNHADTVVETDGVETFSEPKEEQVPDSEETKKVEQSHQKETNPFGVRVMGTTSNPLVSNETTQGGIGSDEVFSAIQGTDGNYVIQGDGVSFVQGEGIFSSVASTSFTYVEIDGKLYEEYYTRLKEHLAANCKEITVEETVDGEPVEAVLAGGFSELTALEKVTLPASIRKIGSLAFYRCTNLTDLTFLGTVDQWNAIEKATNWDRESGNYTVHCIDGDIAKQSDAQTGEK